MPRTGEKGELRGGRGSAIDEGPRSEQQVSLSVVVGGEAGLAKARQRASLSFHCLRSIASAHYTRRPLPLLSPVLLIKFAKGMEEREGGL